ncbi:hypothetical protein C8R45DRAFT_948412 [Mycena sanguinolenta]|nr:hypothetical protein C8R45DRAFT_948412 [Mycena sanguinolenta]
MPRPDVRRVGPPNVTALRVTDRLMPPAATSKSRSVSPGQISQVAPLGTEEASLSDRLKEILATFESFISQPDQKGIRSFDVSWEEFLGFKQHMHEKAEFKLWKWRYAWARTRDVAQHHWERLDYRTKQLGPEQQGFARGLKEVPLEEDQGSPGSGSELCVDGQAAPTKGCEGASTPSGSGVRFERDVPSCGSENGSMVPKLPSGTMTRVRVDPGMIHMSIQTWNRNDSAPSTYAFEVDLKHFYPKHIVPDTLVGRKIVLTAEWMNEILEAVQDEEMEDIRDTDEDEGDEA